MLAIAAALALLPLGGCASPFGTLDEERIAWRASIAVGRPDNGRLVDGVQLPAEGGTYVTWDPAVRRSPSRGWRRWGTDRLLRTTLCVIHDYRAAHPEAPRIAIGDVSRPRGGPFGRRFGGKGHFSHQNGLDVDVYYPRRDGAEAVPRGAADIDVERSQELVDRFVAAGAIRIYVGPRAGLTGPRAIVRVARHHDDHMHVRVR